MLGVDLPKNEDGSITVDLGYEGKVTFKQLGDDGWWGIDSENRLCIMNHFVDGTFDVCNAGIATALEDEDLLARINGFMGTKYVMDDVNYRA